MGITAQCFLKIISKLKPEYNISVITLKLKIIKTFFVKLNYLYRNLLQSKLLLAPFEK